MAKKIIVKLWKDGVGKSLVATSQVITLDGLGSGPVRAGDFADNTLQGSVNTSAQRGGFYKELKSPLWSLSALKPQVTSGNNIVLNWATRPADITPTINWYAVNSGQQIIYTGGGLVSNKSSSPLVIAGESGTFVVATAPVDIDRTVEITIWNGEFGISNLLARSGPIKIIAKELDVRLPQSVQFKQAIPLTITGYPYEFVTYEGSSLAAGQTNIARGIKGNVTLDAGGSFYLPDIRGGIDSLPGNYSYTFDGNITAKPKNATVIITSTGFYALQFTTVPPSVITIGDSLTIGISGAPYEQVTYSGATVGVLNLNSSGTGTTPNLTSGITLQPNKSYSWSFNGNISINALQHTVGTIAGKDLNVTGTSPIAQGASYSVTVTGKALDTVTYNDVKQNIPVKYFDYYPEAEAAWQLAGSPTNTTDWINTYHTQTGSGLGFLSPSAIDTDFNRSFTGSQTLTDIGSGNGSDSVTVVSSPPGLLGRRTPYKFRFYSAQLQQNKEVQVTVNRVFTLKVTGPASVITGQAIPITVYSVAGDSTVKVTGTNLPLGGYTLAAFPSSGQFNFSLQSPSNLTSPLPAGSYTFNFDSSRADVINAGGAAFTTYSVTVTQKQDLQPIHSPLSGFGQDEIPPNTRYELTIRSAVGDVIEIEKNLPASWATTNAYFNIYPDVEALWQRSGVEASLFAQQHYETIGRDQGRVSPVAARQYMDTLEPTTKLTFGPLIKPSGSVDYGEVLAAIGTYRYPLTSPIPLRIKGKSDEISKTFRVRNYPDLVVQMPSSATVDTVEFSIRGDPNDTITCVKIAANTVIPTPLTPRQERTFVLDFRGVFGGELIAEGINELTPKVANNFLFYSKKTNASTQASVIGLSLVVQDGRAMLYSTDGTNLGSRSDKKLMADLPTTNQPVWIMYAIVGGGGGGGGSNDVAAPLSNQYPGGSGSQGMGMRGVIRIAAGGAGISRKIYGVAGGGGRPGGLGAPAAGGLAGIGAGFTDVSASVDASGGDGSSSSNSFITGGGGGGGGMSALYFEVTGIVPLAAGVSAGGGGGGAGSGSQTNVNGGGGIGQGGGPAVLKWPNVNVTDFKGRNGVSQTGNFGGGGGGGGGAGYGGNQTGRTDLSLGTPFGGAAGHNYVYENSTATVLSHDYEAIPINDTSSYITKLEPQDYWGLGGRPGGAGSPGAIKIYWTTSATKPTDWSLLPSWPYQVDTSGSLVNLNWNFPTVSLESTVLNAAWWLFSNAGIVRAQNMPNTVKLQYAQYVTLANNAPVPTSLLKNYYLRITLVNDGRVNTGTGAVIKPWVWTGGPANPGESRTYKFSEFPSISIYGIRAPLLGSGSSLYSVSAQHKIEILSPDQLTVVNTAYINWT